MSPRLLVDAQARLGECALWCERTSSLWWTDIEGCTLGRWQAADRSVQHWTLPRRVGSFALCAHDGRLLVALADGIALFDPASGQVTYFRALDLPQQRGIRINGCGAARARTAGRRDLRLRARLDRAARSALRARPLSAARAG